jgi:Flp pilus assembly protein TadG
MIIINIDRAKETDGVSAVEFALVSPIILVLLFGIVCFGTVENTYIGVQQLTSEAARASVAGLSDTERSQIVQTFITSNIGSYAFLDPTKISATSSTINANPSTYQVSVTYNMSGSFIYQFGSFLPLPSPLVQRSAVVLNGGA